MAHERTNQRTSQLTNEPTISPENAKANDLHQSGMSVLHYLVVLCPNPRLHFPKKSPSLSNSLFVLIGNWSMCHFSAKKPSRRCTASRRWLRDRLVIVGDVGGARRSCMYTCVEIGICILYVWLYISVFVSASRVCVCVWIRDPFMQSPFILFSEFGVWLANKFNRALESSRPWPPPAH